MPVVGHPFPKEIMSAKKSCGSFHVKDIDGVYAFPTISPGRLFSGLWFKYR